MTAAFLAPAFPAAFAEVAVAPRRADVFVATTASDLGATRFFAVTFFAVTFFAATVLRAADFGDATFVTTFFVAALFFVATFLAAAFFVAFLDGAFCADAVFTAPRGARDGAFAPPRDAVVPREPVRVFRVAISASIGRGCGYGGTHGIQAG
jgi:cell division protein FtsW (lipid II flippase)